MAHFFESYELGRQASLTEAEVHCLPWMRVVISLFFFRQNVLACPDQEEKWRSDLICASDVAAREMLR